MAKILFDNKFLHQLDSLKLVSKRARKIFFQGERRGGKTSNQEPGIKISLREFFPDRERLLEERVR